MMRTAIQLYTLREIDEPLPEILARVGEVGFDGVEFAGLGDADPADVADALDDAGLEVAAAHVPIDELEDDPGRAARIYHEIGCEWAVVPYLDASHFESEEAATRTARRLDELAARMEGHSTSLCYHNHDHEFVDVGGKTGFEVFLDESELEIELDLGWTVAAGRDPVALIDSLGDRTPLVHVKDTLDGEPVELGEGDVDLSACVNAARNAGTDWLVYEHDAPSDPLASLAHGAEHLRKLNE
ncbi:MULTISPECIES: sugar phosphate isomerase/epimerase [unclassified Haladaptatus]|nr:MULTISPECIES: sugar phosphate isomerase/epimerase [unclassified Haladaptatus]MCO8242909.1 sugar phosphate isomerase/epimerase [Haladaptatus sp. AB643]MCO8252666.1 sugar phosphate isomerase/epimerase [Haladaptatus sp. AB618]